MQLLCLRVPGAKTITLLAAVVWLASATPQSVLAQAAETQAEASHEADLHGAHATDSHASQDHAPAGTHSAGSDHAAGDHHDPFDLTHANGSPHLTDPAAMPAMDLAIWTMVVFGLLLLVLRKFAWGPIMDALHQREQYVADQLTQARQSNEEAQRLLAEHQQKLTQAHEEIRQLMDQSRKDSELQKQQIITEAERAAQQQKDRAVQAIDAAKNAALSQLAERSVDTAVGLAGRIVKRQLSRDDHAELVREALQHFPGRN